MTTEKTDNKDGFAEKCAAMDCCSPQKMAEMMAKCGDEMKCGCGAMMQERMKDGCCQPEEK